MTDRFFHVTVAGRTYYGAVAQALCEAIEQRVAALARVAELEAEVRVLRECADSEAAARGDAEAAVDRVRALCDEYHERRMLGLAPVGSSFVSWVRNAVDAVPVQAPMPEPHDPETNQTEDQG